MIRSLRVPRLLTASMALALVISCDNPVCGCITPARALVYGRVTGPSGAGVEGAIVLAEQGRGTCDQDFHEELGYARTAADGRYRLVMRTPGPPGPDDCLRAFARPPPASLLTGSDSVEFDVGFDHEGPMDSVRVDLVLREP